MALHLLFLSALALNTSSNSSEFNCTENPFYTCQFTALNCTTVNETLSCISSKSKYCRFGYVDGHRKYIVPQENATYTYMADECFMNWYSNMSRGQSIQDFCNNFESMSDNCLTLNANSDCKDQLYSIQLNGMMLNEAVCSNGSSSQNSSGDSSPDFSQDSSPDSNEISVTHCHANDSNRRSAFMFNILLIYIFEVIYLIL